jgi:hypothetical protein
MHMIRELTEDHPDPRLHSCNDKKQLPQLNSQISQQSDMLRLLLLRHCFQGYLDFALIGFHFFFTFCK